MSQWTDRIRNHPVWQQLNALGPVIDQAAAREGNDPTIIDGLERLRAVLAFSGKRLAATDPFLTHPSPLDSLNSALQSALTEVQAFIANGNVGHITNANSYADSILTHLTQLHVPIAPDDLTTISASAAAYRTALEEHLRQASASNQHMQTEANELRTKLTELANELAAERQRLSSLSSEHQSQFSTAQETRNRDFTDAQTARQEKYGGLISDYTQKLTEQNAEFTRQRELAITAYELALTRLKSEYVESAKSIVDQITDHKQQVEKLVGVIGNLGVTSGYLKTANYSRWSAWFWQLLTVGSLITLIYVAYNTFIPVVEGSLSWEGFAARVVLLLTVGVLAAYARSQADKFLEVERRNRKLALELEALGPYLAPLPKEMQDKFRVDVGDRSFGQDEPSLGRRGDGSPATVVDLLKSKDFREGVSEIVKAVRNA